MQIVDHIRNKFIVLSLSHVFFKIIFEYVFFQVGQHEHAIDGHVTHL